MEDPESISDSNCIVTNGNRFVLFGHNLSNEGQLVTDWEHPGSPKTQSRILQIPEKLMRVRGSL